MAILRLQPCFKDYIWGGRRLLEEYNKRSDKDIAAESWELSCYPGSASTIAEGPDKGKSLPDYIEENGSGILGSRFAKYKDFPILIKFIDAADDLSVQVHPGDEYALSHEGQHGKTELWYVLDAAEDSFLYYGFKHEISRDEFASRIADDSLPEVLHREKVKKGDVIFVPPGTLHRIGKGLLLVEIQQSSNVTYRIFDYGRLGKDGKRRELHVDKALDVTLLCPPPQKKDFSPHLGKCEYFTVDLADTSSSGKELRGFAGNESFLSIIVVEGNGYIEHNKEKLPLRKGDSLFLTAGSGEFLLSKGLTALLTTL